MLFHYQVRSIYFHLAITDFRKGVNSLSGIITNLGMAHANPMSGDLYVFCNKRKNCLKMFHWQGDGYALFVKKLEKGTYELPTNAPQVSYEELLFTLQGVVKKSIKKHARYTHEIV